MEQNKYFTPTVQEMVEAEEQGIDLEHKYGVDGQYINFRPRCIHSIQKGDVIVQGDVSLWCVEPNVFVIYDKEKAHFVNGWQLVKEFSKLEV